MDTRVWRVGVDIGGTFTDFVVLDETSGDLHNFKLSSTPRVLSIYCESRIS